MTNLRRIFATAFVSTLISGTAFADTSATTQATAVSAAPTHSLTVTVNNVRSAGGTIRAQLMKADPASGTAKGVGGTFIPSAQGTVTITFNNLVDGDYAVQMFHDEDGDGQMKTNLFGIPTEGFAFSNAARAAFGPPKFSDMRVTVNADTVTTANMAY
jgi:uncharacterized protein (DUF2141 family)